jgi:hypothetical protein
VATQLRKNHDHKEARKTTNGRGNRQGANRMKHITITVSEDTAKALAELAKACSDADKSRDGATTHGHLTPAKLLAMLAEDVGMVVTRPGCWEASNMYQVLSSHGYEV